MYICIYVYMYIYIYVYIPMYTYIYIHTASATLSRAMTLASYGGQFTLGRDGLTRGLTSG